MLTYQHLCAIIRDIDLSTSCKGAPMDHRFETFSLSILELNRYSQKIKELEMKQFGLKANHTMCLYYLGQHPEGADRNAAHRTLQGGQSRRLPLSHSLATGSLSSANSRKITSDLTGRTTCLPVGGALRCKRHPDTHQRSALLRWTRADGEKAPRFLWHSCNHQ